MKTIFIVNPYAGKRKNIESLINSIKHIIDELKADAHVYITRRAGDATDYVKKYCATKGCARFIACGGDGTLNEVLNGALGYDDAEIGVMPIGTGNDFCRNFPKKCDFFDVAKQIFGTKQKCDAIKYTTSVNGKTKVGYCLNMFNIGFDCNVADLTSTMKKKPLVSGSFAYLLSIFVTLVKKKGADLKIELDGKIHHDGKLLLTSLANGSFCGGGVKSNPLASITDGRININIIKNVSRIKFISLLPYYMKGTILDVKNINKYLVSKNCEKICISPNKGSMRLCIDGEITDAENTTFEIVHNAVSFVLPMETANEDAYVAV